MYFILIWQQLWLVRSCFKWFSLCPCLYVSNQVKEKKCPKIQWNRLLLNFELNAVWIWIWNWSNFLMSKFRKISNLKFRIMEFNFGYTPLNPTSIYTPIGLIYPNYKVEYFVVYIIVDQDLVYVDQHVFLHIIQKNYLLKLDFIFLIIKYIYLKELWTKDIVRSISYHMSMLALVPNFWWLQNKWMLLISLQRPFQKWNKSDSKFKHIWKGQSTLKL